MIPAPPWRPSLGDLFISCLLLLHFFALVRPETRIKPSNDTLPALEDAIDGIGYFIFITY
jgi:hypothetical protein